MAPAFLFGALALVLPPSAAYAANNQPRSAGIVEHIIDGTSVNVQRGESNLTLQRGEELQEGDVVGTDGQTVYIQLLRHNEIQIAPHTEVVMEHMGIAKTDEESESSQITLKKGILWALLGNGLSMATPFIIRTDELAVAIAGGNLVMERAETSKTSTLLSLEGTVKYGPDMAAISNPKSNRYLNAKFRVSSAGGKLEDPKRFKRHLLLSYLNKKAKATSKDISNRGFRALSSIVRKDASEGTEQQITWNLPPGVGTIQSATPTTGSNGQSQPSTGGGMNGR
jgi:hypothetical protein